MKKLENERFTILGINSDGDSDELVRKLKENDVTWPQLYEGSEREVATKWNVQGWPTIYILDGKGVIRSKGFLSEAEIEKTVEELLQAKR